MTTRRTQLEVLYDRAKLWRRVGSSVFQAMTIPRSKFRTVDREECVFVRIRVIRDWAGYFVGDENL